MSTSNTVSPVRLSRGSEEGSAAGARGVERSETTRATAGDGPNAGTLLSRADSPGATTFFPCPNSHWEAPGADTCPGGKAATDAQWGDRAFERQYRDRMGLRRLVCLRARSIAPGMGAD